jgi:hypothetical protein
MYFYFRETVEMESFWALFPLHRKQIPFHFLRYKDNLRTNWVLLNYFFPFTRTIQGFSFLKNIVNLSSSNESSSHK